MTPPLSYVDPPDCPPGMTLDEYRRRDDRPMRRSPRRLSLRRRVFRSPSRRRQAA